MAAEKKLTSPVTLFAAIEEKQHAALRELAFQEKRSLADLAREAIAEYLKAHSRKSRAVRA